MNTFKTFSEKVDKKFENLNDRITAVVNQNKCFDESSTSSMFDIRQQTPVPRSSIATTKTQSNFNNRIVYSKNYWNKIPGWKCKG